VLEGKGGGQITGPGPSCQRDYQTKCDISPYPKSSYIFTNFMFYRRGVVFRRVGVQWGPALTQSGSSSSLPCSITPHLLYSTFRPAAFHPMCAGSCDQFRDVVFVRCISSSWKPQGVGISERGVYGVEWGNG
jgi:hypothetical protein